MAYAGAALIAAQRPARPRAHHSLRSAHSLHTCTGHGTRVAKAAAERQCWDARPPQLDPNAYVQGLRVNICALNPEGVPAGAGHPLDPSAAGPQSLLPGRQTPLSGSAAHSPGSPCTAQPAPRATNSRGCPSCQGPSSPACTGHTRCFSRPQHGLCTGEHAFGPAHRSTLLLEGCCTASSAKRGPCAACACRTRQLRAPRA